MQKNQEAIIQGIKEAFLNGLFKNDDETYIVRYAEDLECEFFVYNPGCYDIHIDHRDGMAHTDMHIDPGEGFAELEAIYVDSSLRGKGIGSRMFDAMMKCINVYNTVCNHGKKNNRPVEKITGTLSHDESAFDHYDESIPFYIRQAEKHHMQPHFYYEDDDCEWQEVRATYIQEIVAVLDEIDDDCKFDLILPEGKR